MYREKVFSYIKKIGISSVGAGVVFSLISFLLALLLLFPLLFIGSACHERGIISSCEMAKTIGHAISYAGLLPALVFYFFLYNFFSTWDTTFKGKLINSSEGLLILILFLLILVFFEYRDQLNYYHGETKLEFMDVLKTSILNF